MYSAASAVTGRRRLAAASACRGHGGHCVTATLQESDLRLELVHAPLVDAIEELDGVEQPHGHFVCPQPPLVWLALIGLGIVELLDLGMEPQPLGGQHCTAPIP